MGRDTPEENLGDTIQTLTDANWDADVMKSEQPVLVDFWADWCAPCKTLLPAVESVAEQFKGRLRVGKVNVEENEQVPFQYNITTLPTLLVIKGGKVSEQRVGLISRDNLVKLIEPHLG
jgi:thioredoxin 1